MNLLECGACHLHVAGPAQRCPACHQPATLHPIAGDFKGALSADGAYIWDGAAWQSTGPKAACPHCGAGLPIPTPPVCPYCHQSLLQTADTATGHLELQVMRSTDDGASWEPIQLSCPRCGAPLQDPGETKCPYCAAEIGELQFRLKLMPASAGTKYQFHQKRTTKIRVSALCPKCGSKEIDVLSASPAGIYMHCRACNTDYQAAQL